MRVDTRAGSEKLITPLRAAGVEVEETILPAGDVEIIGSGPGGRPVLVGVEHKTVEDAVACMRNGRFAEQMRGMKEFYEISWLVIEGRWTGFEPRGRLSSRRKEKWFEIPGHVTYQEMTAWALTMSQAAGVLLWRTEGKEESVYWLRALELWWTAKEWEDHRAHQAVYTPPVGGNPFLGDPGLVVRVAGVLPGVGGVKAERVAKRFPSVEQMISATPKEWMEVEGIGTKIAHSLYELLRGEGRSGKRVG